MMTEGLNLMLYGMGTVFVFLTLLVMCTIVMSSVVRRLSGPEPVSPDSAPVAPLPDQRLISVIEAAIAQHRGK